MTAQRLVPWYLVSCAVPYLPYLAVETGLAEAWLSLQSFVLGLLVAAAVAVGNLIAGPLLFRRLVGIRRVVVALAFLAGAVFPGVVFVAAFFEEPERPAFIESDS